MKARLVDLSRSLDGRQRLTIEVEGDARQLFDELHDQPVELTVKKFHPGRSLNANGYAWVLIDKIAEKMRLSKTDVYRDHIREIGGVSEEIAREALRLASHKLPIKTKFVKKEEVQIGGEDQ